MPTREEALALLLGPGGPFEMTEAEVLGVSMRIYKNAPPNLRTFVLALALGGDKPFFVYGDERTTYAEAAAQVAALATALREDFGVQPGDRVAIGMRNYPEWAIAFWACQALGAVSVSLNAWWTAGELEYGITDSGSKVLLLDGERADRLAEVVAGRPGVSVVVTRPSHGGLAEGWRAWSDVLAAHAGAALPDADPAPDDDATILYTSGTTGLPKGAVGSNRNHVTNIMNSLLGGALAQAMNPPAPPEPGAAPAPPPAGPVALWTFPFFHIGGLTGLYLLTVTGGTLVTQFKWDPAEALELIQREKVTMVAGVPTVVRSLLEHPDAPSYDLSSLASIAQGGSPVPPDLVGKIEDGFAKTVSPGNGYGLTETTSAVVANSGDAYFARKDSVGLPVPTADVRIVDEAGNDVPKGDIGEVWIKGPNVVRGYWNKPEETAQSFTGGWFHTGDAGRIDDDGFLYVVDRIKDVVIRGGENVYCAEVEAALYEHPAVQDVAVVGVPDVQLGEEVAAVVRVRDGFEVTPAELQEHVAARLARFKVPSIVELVTDAELPRNATGKLLKRDIRTDLAARLGR